MRTSGTRKRSTYNWQQGDTPTEGACATCGQQWPDVWDRASRRPTPVHCTGTSAIFGRKAKPSPHHGFVKYPNCWRCNADCGCDQCAGQYPVCQRCAVSVTVEGLVANGPCLNTPSLIGKRHGIIAAEIEHYPLDFQAAYRAAPQELDAQAVRLQQAQDPLRAALAIASEPAIEPVPEMEYEEF